MRRELQDNGYCVVPDVLDQQALTVVSDALERAVVESQRRGIPTYTDYMDPNASNIRVYNLPEFDPIFVELLRNPVALELVEALLGPYYVVSGFTANIALPGSASMNLHSDQSTAVPPPWIDPWAINIIWCLNDVREENGATRYVPGSHHYQRPDDLPADAMSRSLPFEAKAGSIIAMDGRLWHTSGANRTKDERRAMMFGSYFADFVRPQTNHEASLSPEVKARLDDDARLLLGLGPNGNIRLGAQMVTLPNAEAVDTDRMFETSKSPA